MIVINNEEMLFCVPFAYFTGERPFKCPFVGCARSFTTSNIRKVHIRTHTGERPYTCREAGCGRAFASATNYKNHVRIHTGMYRSFYFLCIFKYSSFFCLCSQFVSGFNRTDTKVFLMLLDPRFFIDH